MGQVVHLVIRADNIGALPQTTATQLLQTGALPIGMDGNLQAAIRRGLYRGVAQVGVRREFAIQRRTRSIQCGCLTIAVDIDAEVIAGRVEVARGTYALADTIYIVQALATDDGAGACSRSRALAITVRGDGD